MVTPSPTHKHRPGTGAFNGKLRRTKMKLFTIAALMVLLMNVAQEALAADRVCCNPSGRFCVVVKRHEYCPAGTK